MCADIWLPILPAGGLYSVAAVSAMYVSAMYHGLQHAVTVAILAQGTSWAVAVTQAFLFRWFKPLLATS